MHKNRLLERVCVIGAYKCPPVENFPIDIYRVEWYKDTIKKGITECLKRSVSL